MMSRQSGSVAATSVAEAQTDKASNHRPSPRPEVPVLSPGDMGYVEPEKAGEGAVTREEMVRLFGNALRVR